MKDFGKLLGTFLTSGATVSSITYVGNHLNPLAAGIISGVPISIPSMALIKGRNNQKKFIWSAFIMVSFLSLITGLCSFLMYKTSLSDIYCIVISFLSWCLGAFIYYLYIYGKNNSK
tara:strand:- start:937 stop:1287 length:351 start_codon:yes stop_codon:yes gene_type:complete